MQSLLIQVKAGEIEHNKKDLVCRNFVASTSEVVKLYGRSKLDNKEGQNSNLLRSLKLLRHPFWP